MDNYIKYFVSGIGTLLTYLFGGWSDTLIFLVIVMCLDYLTGVCKGLALKQISSNVGFIGIARKSMIFVILIIATQLDRTLKIPAPIFQTLVCWFFIANESISILENCSALGLPVPEILKKTLIQIKNNSNEGQNVSRETLKGEIKNEQEQKSL